MLPDRHRGLQLVDQRVAGVEGLRPVRAGHADHDRQVPHGQVANPVNRRKAKHVGELGHDVLRDLPQLRLGRRVRRVGKPDHALVGVVVPHGADEQHLATHRRVSDRVPHLVHGQWSVPDGDQPDLTHLSKVPRAPRQTSHAIKRPLNVAAHAHADCSLRTHGAGHPHRAVRRAQEDGPEAHLLRGAIPEDVLGHVRSRWQSRT